MSNSRLSHQGAFRRLNSPVVFAGMVAAVLVLVVSVWIMMSLNAPRSQTPRRPAGQLRADARTLVAAFTFLFESDTEPGPQAAIGVAPLCASNVAVSPLTSASFCNSNQSELFSELITNVPARS